MSPTDIPTQHTLRFLDRVLPAGPRRVLEVGCGNGALAERLQSGGRSVTAIDRAADAVQQARTRGVQAIAADFFEYRDDPFDVVLFSRSLHHLAPLSQAVDHARALLVPDGLLIAEEFAIENVDRDTARWFFEFSDLLETIGLTPLAPEPVVVASNQLERWYAEHAAEQPIHAGEDMLLAVGERLRLVSSERVPYLYRYISGRIESSERGVRAVRWMLDVEGMRVADGSLRAAGLRLVAAKAGAVDRLPPGD
jgi:SAM-dependent methyltransferase